MADQSSWYGSGPDQISLAEILSAIPTVAGAVLGAHPNSRFGAPIGAGLSAVGQLGLTLAERRKQYAQQQDLAKAFGANPQTKALVPFIQAGYPMSNIGGLAKALNPQQQIKPPTARVVNGQLEQWNPQTNQWAPAQGEFATAQSKPPGSAFADWRTQNPNAPVADYLKLEHSFDRPPVTNINMPLSPGDMVQDPVTKQWGFYDRGGVFKPIGALPPERLPDAPKQAGSKEPPIGTIKQIGGTANGASYQYINGAKGKGWYRIGKKGTYTSIKESLGGASLPDFIPPNGMAGTDSTPAPPPGFE